ncbi:MAG: histidine triad nucleotide-binding protein [Candidatus Omnitrophota bacterium]
MSECIFCKIAKGDVKADIVYTDDEIVAFRDINGKAPTHIVLVPRKHIERVADIEDEDALLAGRLVVAAKRLAREAGIEESGYRLVFNCNRDAGQEVFHLHMHLLGGRKFAWPPG